ncbi:TrmH family RNA methyltransferase [Azospirillum agricola]|uniref:TrmH family RNA methyltransferase n=1 Tax=Azospirillum agricola TaxID=1720247 RepID=UPI001AE9E831|nr:RNA methyltransferase [Azospirillum agricola]MBP2227357.1 TrmH family RNA methyltransferase [Azospirillum agricola]
MSRPPLLIESPHNAQFKLWESALDGRGLKKHGKFLLAGLKTVPEALRHHPGRFERLLFTDPAQIAGWSIPPGVEPVQLAPALFRTLDVSGTGFPLLVGDVPRLPALDLSRPPQGLELLCALGDPSNLGALLRSAAAFGASRIVLLEGAAHPFHPKCLRAASNAQFTLTLLRGPRWAEVNAAAGPLYALDGGGADLTGFDWPADMRLILGEEGQGVPDDCPATRLSVPTTGNVESLNATVAVSVALFARFAAVGR